MKIESFFEEFFSNERKSLKLLKKKEVTEFMKPSWQHGEKKVIRI